MANTKAKIIVTKDHTKLDKKEMAEAEMIIDINQKKVIKSRFGIPSNYEITKHLIH